MFNTFVKQTEVNSGGGIRISVYKQNLAPDGSLVSEEPHQIVVGPFDDFDAIIGMNSAALEKMGYPAIDAVELALPLALRKTAHAHPLVQERMVIEAERIKTARKVAEERERDAAESRQRQAEEAAKKEQDRVETLVAAALAKP